MAPGGGAGAGSRGSTGAEVTPGWLGAVGAVLRKELRSLFLAPPAWIFLGAFLALGGLFFYLGVQSTGEASLRPVLPNWGALLIFCLPLVTMRQIAEERRAGTWELLLTAPVPLHAMILGKWLASVCLCGVLLALTTPCAAALWWFGDPDPGVLLTSYLGLALSCAAFSAAGLFASSVTQDQMTAGVGTVLLLLPTWLAEPLRELAPDGLARWLDRISLASQLRPFTQGVIDSGAVAWFAGFTFAFLFLTWRSVESRRWL